MRVKLTLDQDRLVETMQQQAAIGGTDEGGVHRVALSAADGEVRDWFREAMADLGLSIRVDEVGNVFGRREGTDPNAAPVLLGSHLDSQPNGGIYDGALGVVAALEVVRTLEERDIETRHPIEIVDWTDEEGTRFPAGPSGSTVWVGDAAPTDAYDVTDADGIRFEDALREIGYKGDAPAEPGEAYEAYLELHVEQGPRLAAATADVGVVTGIVSRSRGKVTFDGEADHAGTTPMQYRDDAIVAAADLVVAIRRIATSIGERTVGTVGSVDVAPNSINVVPGSASVTWDLRDPAGDVVHEARERIHSEAKAAAEREGVEWSAEEYHWLPRVDFADRCVEAVQAAADDLEYDSVRLISAAGHDAAPVADVTDVGMVFAVSENGKSHSPAEFTTWEHCYSAANTLATAAFDLADGERGAVE